MKMTVCTTRKRTPKAAASHPKPRKNEEGMKNTTTCRTTQMRIFIGHSAVCTMMRGLEYSEAPMVNSEIIMWKTAVAKAKRSTNARAIHDGDC